MKFTENTIFHIYNQGNNRQPIFFKDENYLFFLKKMRDYLLPYGDLLCYCLMPNHFHWLMYVRKLSQEVTNPSEPSEAVTPSQGPLRGDKKKKKGGKQGDNRRAGRCLTHKRTGSVLRRNEGLGLGIARI